MPRLGPGLGRTGACDWTLGQAGAQGTEYCNTCEYGRYVCVVCLGTCLGLLEPFVNKCIYIFYDNHHLVCGSSTLHHPVQSPHPQTTWGDRPVPHIWWQRWDVTLTETLEAKEDRPVPAGDGLPVASQEQRRRRIHPAAAQSSWAVLSRHLVAKLQKGREM